MVNIHLYPLIPLLFSLLFICSNSQLFHLGSLSLCLRNTVKYLSSHCYYSVEPQRFSRYQRGLGKVEPPSAPYYLQKQDRVGQPLLQVEYVLVPRLLFILWQRVLSCSVEIAGCYFYGSRWNEDGEWWVQRYKHLYFRDSPLCVGQLLLHVCSTGLGEQFCA